MLYTPVLNKEISVKILNTKPSPTTSDAHVSSVEVNSVYLHVILENSMIEKFLTFDKLH